MFSSFYCFHFLIHWFLFMIVSNFLLFFYWFTFSDFLILKFYFSYVFILSYLIKAMRFELTLIIWQLENMAIKCLLSGAHYSFLWDLRYNQVFINVSWLLKKIYSLNLYILIYTYKINLVILSIISTIIYSSQFDLEQTKSITLNVSFGIMPLFMYSKGIVLIFSTVIFKTWAWMTIISVLWRMISLTCELFFLSWIIFHLLLITSFPHLYLLYVSLHVLLFLNFTCSFVVFIFNLWHIVELYNFVFCGILTQSKNPCIFMWTFNLIIFF